MAYSPFCTPFLMAKETSNGHLEMLKCDFEVSPETKIITPKRNFVARKLWRTAVVS